MDNLDKIQFDLGLKVNVAIAEKLGWRWKNTGIGYFSWFDSQGLDKGSLKNWAGDIRDAFDLIIENRIQMILTKLGETFDCEIWRDVDDPRNRVSDATPAMAICRAFLNL